MEQAINNEYSNYNQRESYPPINAKQEAFRIAEFTDVNIIRLFDGIRTTVFNVPFKIQVRPLVVTPRQSWWHLT